MYTDKECRDLIASNIYQNFFVEAGAGSGKTTSLVKRMVSLIENGVDVSKICCITFTKAAANEFFNRFQNYLNIRSIATKNISPKDDGLKEPNDITRHRCVNALKDINLCFMGTIDSFCNKILSEHPLEANIPSDAKIAIKEEMDDIYNVIFTKMSTGMFNSIILDKYNIFSTLHKDPKNVFVKLMDDLMSHRNFYIVYDEMKGDEILNLESNKTNLIDDLRQIRHFAAIEDFKYNKKISQKELDYLDIAIKTINSNWADNITYIIQALKEIDGINIIAEDISIFNLKDDDLLEQAEEPYNKKPYEGKFKFTLKTKTSKYIDILNEYIYSVSMDLCVLCIPNVEEELRKFGKFSYFDYIYYLSRMLKNDVKKGGHLIKHIYKQYQYFLIDEFQDTDPLQAEIFFYLSSADNLDEDWTKCKPKEGSLFIVGDPKQSIYRFKGADVSSFNNVRRLFGNGVGQILNLTENFRSNKEMCEYFNETFNELLPQNVDLKYQSPFNEIPLEHKDKVLDNSFRGIYEYEFDSKEKEGLAIVSLIKKLYQNDDYQIDYVYFENGIKKHGLRKLNYKDFMVITPNTTNLNELSNVFNEYNIPAFIEGSVDFKANASLLLIRNIFDVIAFPNNKIKFMNLLMSKEFGFNDNDYINLAKENDEFNFTTLRLDKLVNITNQKLKSLIIKIDKLFKESSKYSSSQLIETIIDNFDIFKLTSNDQFELVLYAIEIIKAHENSGEITSLSEGSALFDKIIINDKEFERCLSLIGDADKVHIANLHKVKGLEAEVVILANPDISYKDEVYCSIIRNETDKNYYLFNLSSKTNFGGFNSLIKTNKHQEIIEEEADFMKAEYIRLLYVAATRARSTLIFGHNVSGKVSYWNKLLCKKEKVEEIDYDLVEPNEEKSTNEINKVETIFNNEKIKQKTYSIIKPSEIRSRSLFKAEEDTTDEEKENTIKREDATIVGTMVHRLMELLIISKNKFNHSYLPIMICNEFGQADDKYIDLLTNILNHIVSGGYIQENGQKEDIFNTLLNAQEVICEMPFSYLENNNIVNGVIDVLYKDNDGWHIVDYKTDTVKTDHKAQLDSYIKAVKIIKNIDADARIYHIDVI